MRTATWRRLDRSLSVRASLVITGVVVLASASSPGAGVAAVILCTFPLRRVATSDARPAPWDVRRAWRVTGGLFVRNGGWFWGVTVLGVDHGAAARAVPMPGARLVLRGRTAALAGWLDSYNRHRPHGSLNPQPPLSRLREPNNPLGSYS